VNLYQTGSTSPPLAALPPSLLQWIWPGDGHRCHGKFPHGAQKWSLVMGKNEKTNAYIVYDMLMIFVMQGLPWFTQESKTEFRWICKRTAHFWKLETNPVAQPMRSIVAAYEHPLGYEAKARSSAWKWWVYSTIHVELRQLRQFTRCPSVKPPK